LEQRKSSSLHAFLHASPVDIRSSNTWISQVLIAGGFNGTAFSLASAEIYDTVANTWSPAASTSQERHYRTDSRGAAPRSGDGAPGDTIHAWCDARVSATWRSRRCSGVSGYVLASASGITT
jgi:hypothetical protein